MEKFMEFLSSKEVIIAVTIALSGVILIVTVLLIEKFYKKHRIKVNTRELNELVKQDAIEELETKKNNLSNNVAPSPTKVVNTVKDKEIEVVKEVKRNVEKPLVVPIEEYKKQNINDVEKIYSEVKEKVEVLETNQKQVPKKHVGKIEYTTIEPNKEEAKEQLRKLTNELMEKEKEQEKEKNIELTKFEQEQERNAIISIDELKEKGNIMYEKNEVTQYKDEGNEPISIQDLEKRMNNITEEIELLDTEDEEPKKVEKTEKIVMDDFETIREENRPIYRDDVVFKSSPIISPIFGIEDNQYNNDMMFENTANYDKFDEEIRKTNEFIVTLKELQKKLD